MESIELICEKFERMGARAKVRKAEDRWGSATGFRIDVGSDTKGEFFDVTMGDNPVEVRVVDCRPRDRHLLLLVKSAETLAECAKRENWSKFLCGHDERHWFVAGVDVNAADVPRAKDMLKPDSVVESEIRHGVRTEDRNRRKTAAFIRQGEWFFVPVNNLDVDESLILKDEPLRRDFRSKAHVVQEVYRRGGVTVHVCRRYPDGLTEDEYRRLVIDKPEAKKWDWRVMVRDPEVFARGYVRHPDHKTVTLNGWHRVRVSNERSGSGLASNSFLD